MSQNPVPENGAQPAAGNGAELSTPIRLLLLASGIVCLGAAIFLILFGNRLFSPAPDAASDDAAPLESLVVGTPRTVEPPINIAAPPKPGEAAPLFLLPDMHGEEISLAQFQGQPVIVNFWATWCAPCIFEMPELQAAYEAHQDSGLVILALNRDEEPNVIGDFLANDLAVDLTFPVLLDDHGEVADSYGILNMPTTYFIDPQGKVTAVHRGPLTLKQIETFLAEMS